MTDTSKLVEIDHVREKLIDALDVERPAHPETQYDIGYNNGLTMAIGIATNIDRLIANGVTVQEWISVKDRLPDMVDSYLVVVKAKYDYDDEYEIDVDVATYNPCEKAYIDDCWNTYNDWDEGQQYLHVTHWMPLPPAPKGE